MRGTILTFAASLALTVCFTTAQAQTGARKPVREWWHESYPGEPLNSPEARKLPRVSVSGNRFVDPQGRTLFFRGVSISDPDKIEQQGRWGREHFVRVKDFGATLVRIPVHPVAWRLRGPQAYMTMLEQAVAWCTELGLYVLVDWHSIGNLESGLFQNPMYETSKQETAQFWRTIARRFAGHHTVAFYELYNEPTTYQNQLGRASWDEWRRTNEDLIAIVRAFDKEVVPLVAGFDWAYDLTPLLEDPLRAEGVGYVTHPYPWKRTRPWEPKWEENFGFAAARWPIIASEIGFDNEQKDPAHAGYGEAIVAYLEAKGISWIAWVFDPEWHPQLIQSWRTYAPTASGAFFSQAMKQPLPEPTPQGPAR